MSVAVGLYCKAYRVNDVPPCNTRSLLLALCDIIQMALCILQILSEEEVWFSSPGHRQVSAKLAAVCSAGVMPCGQMAHATPVTWQLIRGAAVADFKVIRFSGF